VVAAVQVGGNGGIAILSLRSVTVNYGYPEGCRTITYGAGELSREEARVREDSDIV